LGDCDVMKTYESSALVCVSSHDEIVPGTIVCHYIDASSRGIVVWVVDDECGVIWSKEPVNPFAAVISKARSVGYTSIVQQMTTVQPMSMPSSLIFYMDYQYGKVTPAVAKTRYQWIGLCDRRHYMRDRTRDARTFPCMRRKLGISGVRMRKNV
jgi:hypothetical protein